MSKSAGVIIGQASPYANQFVESVQKPFKASVDAIVDPVNKARAAGTLTYEDLVNAQQRFEDSVTALTDTQSSYEKLGKGQKKVIDQSRTTLAPYIQTVRDTFKMHLDATPNPADAPGVVKPPPVGDPPSVATILDPVGSTPEKAAQGAAWKARKQAKGGGRMSTILTGPLGLANSSKAAPKTLLGY